MRDADVEELSKWHLMTPKLPVYMLLDAGGWFRFDRVGGRTRFGCCVDRNEDYGRAWRRSPCLLNSGHVTHAEVPGEWSCFVLLVQAVRVIDTETLSCTGLLAHRFAVRDTSVGLRTSPTASSLLLTNATTSRLRTLSLESVRESHK